MKGRLAALAGRANTWRRRVEAGLLRRLRALVSRLRGGGSSTREGASAVVTGRDEDLADVADAVNRAAWYLGGNPGVGERPSRVVVYADGKLDGDAIRAADPPAGQPNFRPRGPAPELRPRSAFRPDEHAEVLVRDVRDLARPGMLARLDRARLVDERLYGDVPVVEYLRASAAARSEEIDRAVDRATRQNLRRLRERGADREAALVLGTGPSVERLPPDAGAGRAVVVCNSLVGNRELLDRLRPLAVCFADPVFHFGPSEYAARFREDLARVLESHDAFAVTNRRDAGLLLQHRPALEERIVGLHTDASSWRPPDPEGPRVRGTWNVLTHLMLPVACSLAGRVEIGGCDGREPDEDYFWRHGDSVQYTGLMRTAFETHPGFFRDRDYADYYRRHCRELEDQLTAFERRGHEFASITPSHVPALSRRAAAGAAPG